jgi:hypothetical protein
MTDKTRDDQIFSALEIAMEGLKQRGFTELEIADDMLSYAYALAVKLRAATDVARHLQMMALQITAEELQEAAQPRH